MSKTYRVNPGMTLAAVADLPLAPGDEVLFQRGGVWRGTLPLKGGVAGDSVRYGAFGDGAAPMLMASADASRPGNWLNAGNGLWRLALDIAEDVGAMWFDGEAAIGFKKDALADIADDQDFHCDRKAHATLLKSAENPAERFGSIELALGMHGLSLCRQSGVVIDGLHIRGAGHHGFSASEVRDVTIRNCTFDRIGGGELYVTPEGVHVRYGNAIEFWGDAEDILVESNVIDQVYDAALTHQCGTATANRNIVWRGNRVSRAEYSYEYWQQGEGSVTEGVLVEGNVFDKAGYGFGHAQRWNPNAGHLIIQDTTARTSDFVIRNNTFGVSKDRGLRLFNDWKGEFKLADNNWRLEPGSIFCQYHGRPGELSALRHLYPGYADTRHIDSVAEIEEDSRNPALYRETPEDVSRFLRDFGLQSR